MLIVEREARRKNVASVCASFVIDCRSWATPGYPGPPQATNEERVTSNDELPWRPVCLHDAQAIPVPNQATKYKRHSLKSAILAFSLLNFLKKLNFPSMLEHSNRMSVNAATFLENNSPNDTKSSIHEHLWLFSRFEVDNTCPGRTLTGFGYHGPILAGSKIKFGSPNKRKLGSPTLVLNDDKPDYRALGLLMPRVVKEIRCIACDSAAAPIFQLQCS